tara:strand:+ start:114 stop:665 length:552 start_codon:yes stop_codon:yes gene_type:complete
MQNDIIWSEIKKNKVSQKTAGSGVYHLSDVTTRLLDLLSIKRLKRKEVNSIFGEGTSPKLRKIRNGLQTLLDLNRSEKGKQLGIRVDDFLQHNIQRKNYIISLKDNILTNLLNPKKIYSSKNYSTVDQITQAWINRWVINRIQREDTLKNLSHLNADKLSSSLAFKVDDNEINLFNYNDKEAS